jgi:glycosyltransferase involved in cell wall biosynthesis
VGSPQVSIGLPVYNGDRYLVQSFQSLIGQEYGDFELIVSDNGSTDRTQEICESYARRDSRIRYYRQRSNLGASRNFNFTFKQAKGQYFKWASHDDLLAPGYLTRCVEALERGGSQVVLAYPRTLLVDEHGVITGTHEDKQDIHGACPVDRLASLLSDPDSWCHAAIGLIRTDVLRTTRLLGAYPGSDHILQAELVLRGEFQEVPEPLFLRRVQAGESPSLQAHHTPAELAAWFDGNDRNRLVLPRGRLLVEHVRAIRLAPLTGRQKLACFKLLWRSPFVENWAARLLLGELRYGLKQWAWDRRALGAVRRPGINYLPHRAWALLSGVKRADLHQVALALHAPSASTHAALLEFVARCLSQRSDRQSRATLDEWLDSSHEAYRLAAAKAMGRHRTSEENRFAVNAAGGSQS